MQFCFCWKIPNCILKRSLTWKYNSKIEKERVGELLVLSQCKITSAYKESRSSGNHVNLYHDNLFMKISIPTVCFAHMGINPSTWDTLLIWGILYFCAHQVFRGHFSAHHMKSVATPAVDYTYNICNKSDYVEASQVECLVKLITAYIIFVKGFKTTTFLNRLCFLSRICYTL